jgi:MFS family permease
MNQADDVLHTRWQGLWRNADFLKLWAAQSISLFGSEITRLALPLTAALTLNASAAQIGFLAAAAQAPFLVFSLFAGVWADRHRRRPILVLADIARAVLLLSVPLAALVDVLSMAQLYIVTFGVGVLSVVFDVAHYAYVPALVEREQLVDGNSKLQVSYSVAEAAGPGVGGILIQLLTAPFVVLVDAVSFLLSALCLWSIGASESTPVQPAHDQHIGRDMLDGLRALLGQPYLRAIIAASVLIVGFESAFSALYVLYAIRELHLTPALLGFVFAAGGLGAVPGALLAPWAARRFGIGKAIIGGGVLSGLTALLVPLASGSLAVVVAVLAVAQVLGGVTGTIANIHQWSLRQAVTPDQLEGRVTASHRFIVYGVGAVGAFGAGLVASVIGLRPAISVFAVGALLGAVSAVWSPLRHVHEMPLPPPPDDAF